MRKQRGPETDTGCTWEEAKAYCASPELAAELGEADWRLPTKIELESLIDINRVNAVDVLFDDFPIDSVWSSSPYPNTIVDGLKMSWQVDMMEGTSGGRGRTKASRVRCVSSPSATGGSVQAIDFINDVARDSKTQLEWQRYPDSATRSWHDALAYCEKLELDGGGWHLASLKELLTIVDAPRAGHPRADIRDASERGVLVFVGVLEQESQCILRRFRKGRLERQQLLRRAALRALRALVFARRGPARAAAGEDAAPEERTFERTIAVHASAAEACDLANGVEPGQHRPVCAQHPR